MPTISPTLRLGQTKGPEPSPLYFQAAARRLGTYLIGTTGTGKSTLLKSMILQDIHQGQGVCVLDPHGDLIEDILPSIPPARLPEVILFDPADTEYPFGLNLLACQREDPRERDLVTSTLMDTLYKLFSSSWGPRMEDLLRHSLQTLLYLPDSTLLELLLLLTDYEQRQVFIQPACAADPILKHYWEQQFPESYLEKGLLKAPREQTELISSSLNKIGRFLVNPILRHIIAQPTNSISFRNLMDEGGILLVNLSKGNLGADNSAFLGSVLVNQLLLAALSRRTLPADQRRPFYLYVDEYQNFATESFPQLQSEARKFAITTTVAHQYRDQLDDSNKGSTLNVANLMVFRVSGKDALELAGQFDNTPYEYPPHYQPIVTPLDEGVFAPVQALGSQVGLYREVPGQREPYSDAERETANLLALLPQHQCIVRLLDPASGQLRQHRLDIQPFQPEVNPDITAAIRTHSRTLARPLAEVEPAIRHRMTAHTPLARADSWQWRDFDPLSEA